MDDAAKSSDPVDPRDARIARLEARIAELEEIIRRLQRGGRRQAAPFSKGPPKLDPKKPGRKSGDDYGTPPVFRPMPEPAAGDQVIDVPPPEACAACGSTQTVEVRTVVRRFVIRQVRCRRCGKVRRGKHPLQTSTATGCCASQVGPLARAAMAYFNKALGVSLGKISGVFDTLWNLSVTPGGVSHAIQSMGRLCKGDYQALVRKIKAAAHVTCDETGWRIDGDGHWLHAAVTPDTCAYLIDKARGTDATDQLIGEDFAGILVHDGFCSYGRYVKAIHQQCLTHLIRRCGEMIESATPGSAVFPATIKAMLQKSLLLRDERDSRKRSLRSARLWATRLTKKILKMSRPRKKNGNNERLAAFLYRHADELFTFLRHPGVDATNWRGEHAMRQAVVNRKVWGGNRTRAGADVQATLMSVMRTLKLRGVNAIEWLQQKLLDHPRHALV